MSSGLTRRSGRRSIGLGAAALGLAACTGGAGNDGAAANAAKASPPTDTAAPAREEAPGIALDRQRLVDACISRPDRARPIAQLGAARRRALNLCLNTETARQLGGRLPIRIAPGVQIDQVTVAGAALVYRYRMDRRLAEIRPGFAARLEADTRRSACAGEDVQQTIALGGAQIYRWVDRDGASIREVRIDRC